MEQWIIILTIFLAVVFVLATVIQIIWIRNKISNFSESKLSSELTQKSIIAAAVSSNRSNLVIYNVIVDLELTSSLNTKYNPEHIELVEIVAPKSFSVPHVCNNEVKSATLSCIDVGFLVIQSTQSSSLMIADITKQLLMYLMINEKYYLVDIDYFAVKQIQEKYSKYKGYYIVAFYTIKNIDNIVLNTTETCHIDLLPFIGTLSSNNIIDNLMISSLSSQKTKQLHMMGYYKSNL